MNMKKTNKHFVSKIDERLAAFNRTHEKSASQKAEISKYQEISQSRDDAKAPPKHTDTSDLWQE